jgi:hypothetical protein
MKILETCVEAVAVLFGCVLCLFVMAWQVIVFILPVALLVWLVMQIF